VHVGYPKHAKTLREHFSLECRRAHTRDGDADGPALQHHTPVSQDDEGEGGGRQVAQTHTYGRAGARSQGFTRYDPPKAWG